MNRAISIRSRRDQGHNRPRFGISTLRGNMAPELSRKMGRLVKSENTAIGAYEAAGRERNSIAAQLSDWGEATDDDAISDISDKLGVMMAEMGEQEDVFAANLEDYRGVLKQIRNMESSVQPSRDQRQKVTDEIAKLKYKDPNSTRLTTLEHELVRAEAQNLVAEAQLSNISRQKLKEAFDIHLAAVIERAEKQTILAQHARRLLNFIDDSPVVPGDSRKAYEHEAAARKVLEDAENDMRAWQPSVEPIATASGAEGLQDRESDVMTTGSAEAEGVPFAEGASKSAKRAEASGSGALKLQAEPIPA